MEQTVEEQLTEAVERAVSAILSTTHDEDPGDRTIWVAEQIKRRARSYAKNVDTSSSASRQHYIDTGRYLRRGETE